MFCIKVKPRELIDRVVYSNGTEINLRLEKNSTKMLDDFGDRY